MVVGLARAANTEGVGDAVDVTEPGSDERDLQNASIIEADGSQGGMILGTAFCGVFS